jgi:hypothetical protein
MLLPGRRCGDQRLGLARSASVSGVGGEHAPPLLHSSPIILTFSSHFLLSLPSVASLRGFPLSLHSPPSLPFAYTTKWSHSASFAPAVHIQCEAILFPLRPCLSPPLCFLPTVTVAPLEHRDWALRTRHGSLGGDTKGEEVDAWCERGESAMSRLSSESLHRVGAVRCQDSRAWGVRCAGASSTQSGSCSAQCTYNSALITTSNFMHLFVSLLRAKFMSSM